MSTPRYEKERIAEELIIRHLKEARGTNIIRCFRKTYSGNQDVIVHKNCFYKQVLLIGCRPTRNSL